MNLSDDGVFERIAEYMEVSATTAPKAAGVDSLTTQVVEGEELREIGEEMISIGENRDDDGFIRDGNNVLDSEAILLVGSKKQEGLGLDCGGCGYESCQEFNDSEKNEFDFLGPNCIFKLLDLGIALGSAAKTASILNVDNRIMYRIGVVAKKLDYIDATVIMGIPISGKQKNPYFDR
ncbi:hypothetical protein AKJ52_02975 [candidate division MSBL1 archaeon SCGC-AAA382C18]|uniref:4Fe-4S domain-containing protein n=1 Tax=candidate division MSBL1 archaeon SCGC-AAA382C18 TaxID=1698281 RepID=A0A133VHB4_9EURY|nr:hypothetical protein AKJ52_02975 [candidate division MSBL1 archaeon SCGC-AAA382C18]